MLVSWLFLFASLWGAWFTWNAWRPLRKGPRLAAWSFASGWLTGELALHHVAWQLAATAVFAALGALEHGPGRLGLALTVASVAGLLAFQWRAHGAGEVVERALRDALGPDYRAAIRPELAPLLHDGLDPKRWLRPWNGLPRDVERVRDVVYGRATGVTLRLDVYRSRSRPTGAPVLFQIHGGGWVIGSKNEQALPLMHHLARAGWVCVSVDYRLSPHATFPDHLVDCKRALAWVREHVAEYGGDPDFVLVTGGSAGGHLAALLSLTPNDPAYQPGFEQVDTRVAGCVPFYGIYDFLDRESAQHHGALEELLERRVLKGSREEIPDVWHAASPVSQVREDAPPFFVVHGSHDTLVPVGEAQAFVRSLRAKSREPVAYAELPYAQHAFELFPSVRTLHVVGGVGRFAAWLWSRHLAARRADPEPVRAAR
jgi:acetyl esterase/lipase